MDDRLYQQVKLIGNKTEWDNTPLRYRIIHRGKDGKVRASKGTEISSHESGETKRKSLQKALESFIDLYNLFTQEMIEG